MRIKPRHLLKIPQTAIRVGPPHQHRLASHYETTLAHDLLYMQYRHLPRTPLPAEHRPDPLDPYQTNRKPRPLKGNRPLRPLATPSDAESVTRLERVVLHCMVKEAITQPNALWPAAMQLKALSGESYHGGGQLSSQGVQFIRSSSGVAEFKIRAGLQIAAQVELKGEKMWTFVGSLVDFVLPRLRDYRGVSLPPASASATSASATSGVVSFGLPPSSIGLFPQVEVNVDAYPKTHGMHIHFITNARGAGAQARARALLSGLRIPFVRA
ncbi:ribosomal protein L5 [Clavulina sp. PMI_390]|nr:ribosomal protein L5 [Clavulina sp. PMI_390]